MQRSSSPYRPNSRAPSPYRPGSEVPYAAVQSLPTGPAQVGPGAITYTTSTGPDGRVIYHPFKAVAASYQTPSGVISGIQWIPAETTTTVPAGAIQAPRSGNYPGWPSTDFAHKEELKSTQDWQRAEERQRKRDEKEAKRLREDQSRNDTDYELQQARERDAQTSGTRERRKSFVGNAPSAGSVSFPQAGGGSPYPTHPGVATGYPPSPYHGHGTPAPGYATSGGHSRNPSGAYDLARQMNDMDIGRGETQRERKVSFGAPRKSSMKESAYERTRTTSFGDRPNPYPSPPGAYPAASAYTNTNTKGYNASPNIRPSDIPAAAYGTASSGGYSSSSFSSSPEIGRSTTPFGASSGAYPPGHVLYDPAANASNQSRSRVPSRPASRVGSRAPSPNPGGRVSQAASPFIGGRSPHINASSISGEPQQLPAPEAFSRPINASNSFAPFDPIRLQDMDDVYDSNSKLSKMPVVLTTHDIWPEDWTRCMQDLARSWVGQLPVAGTGPDGRPPRRSKLAQDLIELWNASFFLPRGIELVLYKGKERRTGPQAGIIEPRLFEDDDDDSSSNTSDSSEFERAATGPYGRPLVGADLQEARRRHHEEKIDRRRRRKEREAKRKAKAYTVFVSCVRGPQGIYGAPPPIAAGYSPAMPSVVPGYGTSAGYGAASTGYSSPPATYPSGPAYGAPYTSPVVPATRSYGSGY